jgi:hypothetical protein
LTRGYNVPGVYVRDATGPLVTNASVPDAVVTLVGPATGYQSASDAVLASATPQALSHRGVWYSPTGAPAGVVAPVVTNAVGAVLTPNVDYVFADVFDDNGLNNPANRITTVVVGPLTRLADGTVGTPAVQTAGGVKPGDTLVVTYNYTNAAYFTPLLFDGYDSVVATYGAPLLTTPPTTPGQSPITSPLSLAAAAAFQNGATRLICVATDPTPVVPSGGGAAVAPAFDAQLRAAYAKTLGDYRVGVIIPILADGGSGAMSTLIGYGTDLKAHVVASSADGYQRIGILGGQANQVADVAGTPPPYETVAQAIASARVILVYPNRLSYYNPGTNRPIEVDGFYLAAAIGGVLEANPVNQSLTREQVVGFSGLPASITRLCTKPFKDNMSSKGVCVAEVDRQNRLILRHGVSTDMTNVITREVSITRARDALFEALQIGLDNSGLIGSPIDYETTTRIKGAVAGILESLVQDETIIAYTDLRVRQQTVAEGGDPTVIEARFAYQPALPLNYIVVTFSLDLSTGNVNIGDSQSSLPAAVHSGL